MLIDAFTVFGSWPGLPYDHPLDVLVSGLERHKIDRACTLSSKGVFLDAAVGNAATWEACKGEKRLIPIGVADPRVGGVEQVNYCKQQGFKLMALFPASQGWSLGNLSARIVLQHIADAGMPVLIEASREGDASAILEAAQAMTIPIILLDVSLRTLAEALAVLDVRSDTRRRYLEALRAPIAEAVSILKGGPDFYLATRLLCGGDTLEYLAQTLDVTRLVFASRFPISCFSSAFLTAKFANLGEEQRSAVMGGNMMNLLA